MKSVCVCMCVHACVCVLIIYPLHCCISWRVQSPSYKPLYLINHTTQTHKTIYNKYKENFVILQAIGII